MEGEHVALGTNTDPYQWVEGRYKLMRGIWAALRDAANPCSILTKSPLLLRDIDLLKEIRRVADVTACLSVPTLEERAWRATEPHTPHPRARLEAVAELNRQGIPTGVLIAPLMPGINDAAEQVERILALASEAGAVSVGGQTLFLKGAVRPSSSTGCAATGRISWSATSACTPTAAPTCRPPSAAGSSALPGSRGATPTRRRNASATVRGGPPRAAPAALATAAADRADRAVLRRRPPELRDPAVV